MKRHEKALRAILPPLAVFVLVGSAYLLTFTPVVWYADAFNYIGEGVQWETIKIPTHDLSYVGWTWLLSLLPAAQVPTPFNDALPVLLSAKFLSIFFAAAASVGMYLAAKQMLASTSFAIIVTALFAANPFIWHAGQSALTDIPAVAFMLFSFLFFVRFFQGKKRADLFIAAVLAGVAAIVRVQSFIILFPYALGIFAIALEAPKQALAVRVKIIFEYGLILGVGALTLPLLLFGMPWNLVGKNAALYFPRLVDVLTNVRWYVARDIGWFWFLLAWVGLGKGLFRKETRSMALMLVTLIVVGVTYFASMNSWSGADIPRYLIPTIPFTLLGMAFIWPTGRLRAAGAAIILVGAVHVISVFVGLRAPYPPGSEEPSRWAKVFMLQRYLASVAARDYIDHLPRLMDYNAMASVMPERSTVILQGYGNPAETLINLRGKFGIIHVIKINPALSGPERFQALDTLPTGGPVLVYPGADDSVISDLLKAKGYVRKGRLAEAVLYRTSSEASVQ